MRRHRRTYRLPPRLRIRRLPEALPISFGALVFLGAFAKGWRVTLCMGPDPFETANGLMMLLELVTGPMLLHPAMGRRRAALLWLFLMPAAALFLAYMRGQGFDTRSCGCFGPFELEFTTHLAVLGAVFAVATAIFLREETRESDRRYGADSDDERFRERLAGIFR